MRYIRLIFVIIICAYFWNYTKNYSDWHFIDNVNLIFHEAGHSIFMFFGLFISIAMGSVLQITIPFIISIYFFIQKQKISAALCLLWVGQNFLNVSIYAGDAIKQQLDLLGGDSVIHDWNYLLSNTSTIQYTPAIAGILYSTGIMFIIIGTVFSIYFTFQKND